MTAPGPTAAEHWLDFGGKVVAITGAGSGIGRACADLFAKAGASLALADLDAKALETSVKEDGIDPGVVLIRKLDVTEAASCQQFAEEVADRFGAIDALVPCAGIYHDQPFETMTYEHWRQTMSVNLDGVFNTVKPLSSMIKEGGTITLLSSRAGHSGGSLGHVHYGATKGAMLSLARGLARELGPRLRVNAVSPGVIKTPMTAAALATGGGEILEQTPLRRFGSAAEVAATILFLSSGLASFITGETIQVNGGLYMS